MTIDLTTLPSTLLPMVAFCIGIYFIVMSVRWIAEVRYPALCVSSAWSKVLRVMPPLFGGIAAAIMNKYPFLDTLPTWGTRFIYGAFGGGIASFSYLIFKAAVQKWFGVKVDDDDKVVVVAKTETTTSTVTAVVPTKTDKTDGAE